MRYFYDLLVSNRFLPNSPTWTGAGTRLNQLAACFVLPIEDTMESIFSTLYNAVMIQRTGGGCGFTFGHLRPAGSLVKSSGGHSSGPVSFMKAYDAVFQSVSEGGRRRGASMAILPVDHPDILEFINCKRAEGRITNFNLSVGISNAFMHAVLDDKPWDLIDPSTGDCTKTVQALDLFDHIVASAWTNGEPGVVFFDTINAGNPVPDMFTIEATNPCVTSDCVVETSDGPRLVEQLIGKSFFTTGGTPVPGGFYRTRAAARDLVQVETVLGYTLVCTPKHRLQVQDVGWVAAADLQPARDRLKVTIGSLCGVHTRCERQADLKWVAEVSRELLTNAELSMFEKTFGMGSDELAGIIDTLDWSAAATMAGSLWVYAGRPHWSLSLGSVVTTAVARAVHRTLLRLGVASKLAQIAADDSWELTPTAECEEHFRRVVGADCLATALGCLVTHAPCPDFSDLIASVCPTSAPENGTPVYDATCLGADSGHCLCTNGFVSHNCSEIPLSPYESCCLGSINLASHVLLQDGKHAIAWRLLEETVALAVTFLDDVIDRNGFVDAVPELQRTARTTRRIGLGIMGLADVFFRLGLRYGSPESLSVAGQIMEFIRYVAMRQSAKLAEERGPFPAIKQSFYASGKWPTPAPLCAAGIFGYELPSVDIGRPKDVIDWDWLKQEIATHGIRNIATTAIAPTGTLSLVAGVSGFGCEPVFALSHRRRILSREGVPRMEQMLVPELQRIIGGGDLPPAVLEQLHSTVNRTGSCAAASDVPQSIRDTFVCAGDIPVEQHIAMQAALQCFVDGAISKTVNMKPGSTKDDVSKTLVSAWLAGCKGVCVYVAHSRQLEVLTSGDGSNKQ
jgi:ribonucleotide reductase alpha subunit